MKIQIVGGNDAWYVKVSRQAHQLVRSIPSAIKSFDNGFTIPANLAGAAGLVGILPYFDEKEIDDNARELMSWMNAYRTEVQESKTREKDVEELYPFQRNGVSWMVTARCGILADEMGLGKTVQAIRAVDREDAYPALVVTTKSMMHKWAEEWHVWTDLWPTEIVVVDGTKAQRCKLLNSNRLVYVMSHDNVWRHTKIPHYGDAIPTEEEKEPKELNQIEPVAVIVDEAHKIKDPKAKRTRGCWGVGDTALYRYALTGTPVVNNVEDLWTIMRFVDPLGWPSRSRFRDRYCDVWYPPYGGVENNGIRPGMRKEFDLMFEPAMLRRTKAEVLTDLPPKTEEVIRVPMHKDQRKVYDTLREEMIAEVEGGLLVVTDPLVLVGRLRQAASYTPGPEFEAQRPSNKEEALLDIIEEHGPGLVVFSESRRLLELVATKVEGMRLITGGVPGDQRALIVEQFQQSTVPYLGLTLGAGAEGLTLTRADTVVHLQPGWSHVQVQQANDRLHRIGQENNVHIITLSSEDSIDEAALQAQQEKEFQLQDIVRDPAWWKENT